ncbi:LytR/AlgR family response regulator transcription factor [Sediminicola luteus]|uniref:DNA-binding response regulator n=1 Tax=Sediminicola luteus TaxID=319238 RepID=A0A2A4GCA4_9FLAO|nr:response regulator transcription factor [Sediminicola luteus]PCE66237.1 DNA-binding response regulator [Sediminicola luteus]
MPIKCLIIDDEPLAIELVRQHVSHFPDMEVVATAENALEGFDLLNKHQIDLLFLDIQMPKLTGLQFLKALTNPPQVILTTAYREYALESYDLEVLDYLLKPISFERFLKAINKYYKLQDKPTNPVTPAPSSPLVNDHIYVNVNKKHHKVLFQDMLYAESLKDYVRIHTQDDSYTTKFKISDFMGLLPSHFIRVHRSYVVNTQKITAFTGLDVEIDSTEIPIGASYKEDVLASLKGGRE